jgi:hypothetical protein
MSRSVLNSAWNCSEVPWSRYGRARGLQEQVLEASRRVLGPEHLDTSISAWDLFSSLLVLEDVEAAGALFVSDLRWLLERDPATLSANQRQIREYLAALRKEAGGRD